jgi:hypothetical protein
MSVPGQTRHFDGLPITSGLPQSTDIDRPAQLVRSVPGTEVGSFSLYHLVREREQALRESGANHVSRLFVYDEFKSRGCWIGESPGGVPRRSFVT